MQLTDSFADGSQPSFLGTKENSAYPNASPVCKGSGRSSKDGVQTRFPSPGSCLFHLQKRCAWKASELTSTITIQSMDHLTLLGVSYAK
mmetsp:Transcript_42367/g.75921  ORF Transcript_42367/g.75921 Transcript_42367/m.75921 type:complete len:89 (-) Transcript_42367:750-1016(-)